MPTPSPPSTDDDGVVGPRPTPRHAAHAVAVLLEYLGIDNDRAVAAAVIAALHEIDRALRATDTGRAAPPT